ncbi:hypothetical protein [Effusibacillus dendaii]|uniref:YneQ n=1 Tax=Effusibacillus dendaii TaxID=2743772 RepID=A0A7I8D9X9_9BACL|nr:hypothetical protein [Effusibacillus dendaii]BCJ86895.1 hypothetical protein skT53_18800 [Effusibacillus dendaii]
MAFGINRQELNEWKRRVKQGEIAFLTHYWLDPRFPNCKTITKAGCLDVERLVEWGTQYGLKREWIDNRSGYPHFDLLGERQLMILKKENLWEQIVRFQLLDS